MRSRWPAGLVTMLAAATLAAPADAGYADRLVRCFTNPNNPTQQAVAREAITSLQAQGWTFGDIRIALALAQRTNEGVMRIAAIKTHLEVRADAAPAGAGPSSGINWTQVAAELGVHMNTITGGAATSTVRGTDGGGFTAGRLPVLQAVDALACWSDRPAGAEGGD